MGTTRPATSPLTIGWKGKCILASIATILIVGVFLMLQDAGGDAKADLPNDVSGACTIEYVDTAILPGTDEQPTELAGEQAGYPGSVAEDPDDVSVVKDGEIAVAGDPSVQQVQPGSDEITPAQAAVAEGIKPSEDNENIETLVPSEAASGTTASAVKHVYKVTMPDGKKMIVYGTHDGYVPKDGTYQFSGAMRTDSGYNVLIDTAYTAESASDVHEKSAVDFASKGPGMTQALDEFIWEPADGYVVQTGSNSGPAGISGADATDTDLAITADAQDGTDVIARADEKTFPMDLAATALDGKTHLHEGCAYQDDVTIDVDFKYANLFSNKTFNLKGQLVDQFNMNPILDANGVPITFDVPFETKTDYVTTEEDRISQSEITNFLDTAAAIIAAHELSTDTQEDAIAVPDNEGPTSSEADVPGTTPEAAAAEAAEGSPEGSAPESVAQAPYEGVVPTYEQVARCVLNAINNGSAHLTSDGTFLNEFYSYYNSLTDEQKAAYPKIPTFPELVNYVIVAHNATAIRYASDNVDFQITAPAASVYAKKVMAALVLYLGDEEVSKVYEHDEEALSIIYPGITTEATVYGEHEAAATKNIVVMDTVHYVGLVPGVQYHLETILMEKSTQSPVIDATTGESVKVMTEFKPLSASGVVNVIFDPFDATSLNGREAVVYEKLVRCVEVTESDAGAQIAVNAENRETEGGLHSTQMGSEVVIHRDINDKYQTISFSKDHWDEGEVEQGGTISAMGDDMKPFLFVGLIVAALLGIGMMRIRNKMM